MWRDNLELLSAYFLAADTILEGEGHPVDALDISTGPCLAPLMATSGCIQKIQLSDYDASNRENIVSSRIDYWTEYATELASIFPDRQLSVQGLLDRTDSLRKQEEPLDVDLRRSPMFRPDKISPASVGLLSMHFVVDSICDTPEECFELLEKCLKLVRPGGWLLMSSLVDSSWWLLGDEKEPSPRLSEGEIEAYLKARRFSVFSRRRSTRKALQIYEGGWTVFLARSAGNC